jgi:hypothetical protein
MPGCHVKFTHDFAGDNLSRVLGDDFKGIDGGSGHSGGEMAFLVTL